MNKISKIFISIGVILISLSVVLIINKTYKENKAGKNSEEVLSIINDEQKEEVENNNIVQTNNKEMKTITINNYDYIGTINIPALNLELPIMSDCDYTRLDIAPCRYYGNIYTDDLIICGHSYKTHFKYLDRLKQKDIIIFTDIDGNDYIYEVLEIEILSPTSVSEMIDNDFDLTLYTCTDDGRNRITVRCNKVYI